MTVRQLQLLLSYLSYSPGEIDGVAGEKTKSAVEAFQRAEGLAADGEAGVKTQEKLKEAVFQGRFRKQEAERFWKDIRYFTREEFLCPCGKCGGFPVEPDELLVRLADKVREHFGAPATVSSGVRCQAHNDELPGSVPNSYHVRGKAMDFCVRGVSGAKLLAYVQTQPVHYAYQISGSDFVHMDVS